MKTYKLNDQEYELIKNYRDGFDLQETKAKFTDYFTDYDCCTDSPMEEKSGRRSFT